MSGSLSHVAAPGPRLAKIERNTLETQIQLELCLDGTGRGAIRTGVGFLDHMLTLLAKHGGFDLGVTAHGDLHVDGHHTVEDVGICLGQAFQQALGNKQGIARYGHMTLPMEESLVTTAVDFGGRPFLVYQAPFPTHKIGEFDTELVREFWQAFVNNSLCNLHIVLQHGFNSHHIAEAIFKATARACRMAVARDLHSTDLPSTKGVL